MSRSTVDGSFLAVTDGDHFVSATLVTKWFYRSLETIREDQDMHKFAFDMRPMLEPVFCRSCRFGAEIQHWEPEPGNSVALSSGSVRVLATITEAKGRRYKGKIIGFENWNEHEYQGVKADDEIEFGYEHLFTCMQ